MEIPIEKIREIALCKTNGFRSTHPNYTPTEKTLASMLLHMKLELDAVMQLAVDKWLNDDDTDGNPASRAAKAREVALTAIDKAEKEAEKLALAAERMVRTWGSLDSGVAVHELRVAVESFRKENNGS